MDARREAQRLRAEIESALRERRIHELLPFAGETAGLLHDVLPAAEIVRRMVDEAQRALELGGILADTRLGERA